VRKKKENLKYELKIAQKLKNRRTLKMKGKNQLKAGVR
jgi:hypothetical protein